MWKRWFKKFIPDYKSVQEHPSSLGGLKKHLRHSYLWHFDREAVARGVAIGLFAGIVPIIPFQTLLAIFLSIFLHGNLPVAFLASWISNPVTIVPITYFIYYVGETILGKTNGYLVVQDFTWNFSSLSDFWVSFTAWIYQFGKAFFVGLPIVSIGTALIGYFMVTIIWHIIPLFKQRAKKNH